MLHQSPELDSAPDQCRSGRRQPAIQRPGLRHAQPAFLSRESAVMCEPFGSKCSGFPPPVLHRQRLGDNVVLDLPNAAFGLSSAPTVTGTFTNVPGATKTPTRIPSPAGSISSGWRSSSSACGRIREFRDVEIARVGRHRSSSGSGCWRLECGAGRLWRVRELRCENQLDSEILVRGNEKPEMAFRPPARGSPLRSTVRRSAEGSCGAGK